MRIKRPLRRTGMILKRHGLSWSPFRPHFQESGGEREGQTPRSIRQRSPSDGIPQVGSILNVFLVGFMGSFPFEQEIHVSLRQVVCIVVHVCVRVHTHYTVFTTRCAYLFHRIHEAASDLEGITIDPARYSHQVFRV